MATDLNAEHEATQESVPVASTGRRKGSWVGSDHDTASARIADTALTDRYWWACGPEGWWIETWRGDPKPENVVRLAMVPDLDAAVVLVTELCDLAGPVLIDGDAS